MSKHKQPLKLAILKGADKKDPQRYRDKTAQSSEPLGACPEYLTPLEIQIWNELEKNSIPGVLTGADRFIMELACGLLAEYREKKQEFQVGKYSQLISALGRLGLSPADRQKVSVGEPKKPGGFDQFT